MQMKKNYFVRRLPGPEGSVLDIRVRFEYV